MPSASGVYREKVIPYWRGRSMRDRLFAELPEEWKEAYAAGIFTEFMEQRAPGHTVLDDKIYRKGMLDFKKDIADGLARLDFLNDPQALDKREALKSFDISCDALIVFAERHAALARRAGGEETDARAQGGAAEDRRGVHARAGARPARFPRGAAVLLVLPPGRDHRAERLGLVQPRPSRPAPAAVLRARPGRRHADPGERPRAAGVLLHQVQQPSRAAQGRRDRRRKRHLHRLRQHQHRRPAARRLGRLERGLAPPARHRGRDAPAAAEHEHPALAQEPGPLSSSTRCAWSARATVSRASSTPTPWCRSSCARARRLEDARAGGCSGCVEVGAFGKEAYILTGYFNLPKVFELALHNGVDPRPGKQLGPRTGEPDSFETFDGPLCRLSRAVPALPRDQAARQPVHRADVRHADARAVPERADRRLHRTRPRLQRRRRALQQHLHPVRRPGQPHRQPERGETNLLR